MEEFDEERQAEAHAFHRDYLAAMYTPEQTAELLAGTDVERLVGETCRALEVLRRNLASLKKEHQRLADRVAADARVRAIVDKHGHMLQDAPKIDWAARLLPEAGWHFGKASAWPSDLRKWERANDFVVLGSDAARDPDDVLKLHWWSLMPPLESDDEQDDESDEGGAWRPMGTLEEELAFLRKFQESYPLWKRECAGPSKDAEQ